MSAICKALGWVESNQPKKHVNQCSGEIIKGVRASFSLSFVVSFKLSCDPVRLRLYFPFHYHEHLHHSRDADYDIRADLWSS